MEKSAFCLRVAALLILGACAPVEFNKILGGGGDQSSSSTVGPPAPDDKMHTTSTDCAAGVVKVRGSAKVTDPNGYTIGHNSCTPNLSFDRDYAIPSLADQKSYTLLAVTPNAASALTTWDIYGCDRSYLATGFAVKCENGKRVISSLEVKYTIGRTDDAIYVYRSSFVWKPGEMSCETTSGLACHGPSASFYLTSLLATIK